MKVKETPSRSVIDPRRTHLIACATVIEELLSHLPPGMGHQVLDFGLHINPQSLKETLQETIDRVVAGTDSPVETILLGYGLCSQAVAGLKANNCTLVVPRVDDCIAIFLGSDAKYRHQFRSEPGTYYLTKGWIEAGDSPFDEFKDIAQRYGEEKAAWIMGRILKGYTRLALINTGQYELERYRAYCRTTADRFGLRFEEIEGSDALVTKLLNGPWDDDFVVARPGETITYLDFKQPRSSQ